MDMHSKNQYLEALLQKFGYHRKSKKEKGELLDEYCKTTGENRKYVIRKIRSGKYIDNQMIKRKRKRKSYYDSYVTVALIRCWRIFDYPCGQRLEQLLKNEVERLRKLGELKCSDTVAEKLKKIGFRTIDEKLKREKEILHLKRKYHTKNNPLLYQKIPIKLSGELDRTTFGHLQIDLVEHCGESAKGEYICTLSNIDIANQWFEGEAVIGRSQRAVFRGLQEQRKRFPFQWKSIHPDNGTEFINDHLWRYTKQENLGFSRSRPYKKNDNCFVEQKNWTHVKKVVGYYRYDSYEELTLLNELYRGDLRVYKNFFQPVMKLISKERIGGKIIRKYDTPKIPYQRVMESHEVSEETKRNLKAIYESSNPAELRRRIDKKLIELHRLYKNKKNRKTQTPSLQRSKNHPINK